MQEEVARLAGGGEGVCGDGLEWGQEEGGGRGGNREE